MFNDPPTRGSVENPCLIFEPGQFVMTQTANGGQPTAPIRPAAQVPRTGLPAPAGNKKRDTCVSNME